QASQALGRLTGISEIRANVVVRGHVLEGVALFAMSEEVSGRVRPALRMRRRAENSHEPVRLRIRQHSKQIRVQHTEHSRICSDAERYREHGNRGESRILKQHSNAET